MGLTVGATQRRLSIVVTGTVGATMPRTAERNLLPANDSAVKATVARDGKTTESKIADSDGLTLRVEPAHGALVRGEPVGKAAYYVRYTARGGKRQRLRIGARGVVSLRDARAKAKEVALAVGKGEDPVASAIERSESPTLRKLWEDRKQHGEKLAPGTQKYYEQALNQYAFPEWATHADEITADHSPHCYERSNVSRSIGVTQQAARFRPLTLGPLASDW